MNRAIKVMLVIGVTCVVSARAQEVPLSLDEALAAALKNNPEIHLARFDEAGAGARYRQSNAALLPQVTLSYSGMSTDNPLNAFGFKLQQQAIRQQDFDPERLNAPSATQNFATKAAWHQPLVNADAWAARQAAREEQSVYAFKTTRTTEYVAFEIQQAYAGLRLAQQAAAVLEEALLTVQAIHAATGHRFEKGYLQKSDVLQVMVQVKTTETQLAEARSHVANASDHLALLMGEKGGTIYRVDSTGLAAPMENLPVAVPDDRADFRAAQAAIGAQEKMIQAGTLAYLPKLNAFGEYMFNDSEALGFGSGTYLVGAQLTWTLFNGTATRNLVAERRAARDKTAAQLALQKEQAQLELNKTVRQVHDAGFALQQQEAAVHQASEALRIVQNRYRQGLVTTTEVLQAQSLLAQQKLLLAQAGYQHQTTIAYQLFLTAHATK